MPLGTRVTSKRVSLKGGDDFLGCGDGLGVPLGEALEEMERDGSEGPHLAKSIAEHAARMKQIFEKALGTGEDGPAGSVEVAWAINEEKQRLGLIWTERGGPMVQPPLRRSFGTRMIESLGQQLNGQVRLTYDPSGFVYSLDVPLCSIIAAA